MSMKRLATTLFVSIVTLLTVSLPLSAGGNRKVAAAVQATCSCGYDCSTGCNFDCVGDFVSCVACIAGCCAKAKHGVICP